MTEQKSGAEPALYAAQETLDRVRRYGTVWRGHLTHKSGEVALYLKPLPPEPTAEVLLNLEEAILACRTLTDLRSTQITIQRMRGAADASPPLSPAEEVVESRVSEIALIIDPHAFAPIAPDMEPPFDDMVRQDRELALSKARRIAPLCSTSAEDGKLAELEAEVTKLKRVATDRRYMLDAYRSMLGETGLKVAKMWDEKGVIRTHFDWASGAHRMTGEERAQFILGLENLPSTQITSDADFGPMTGFLATLDDEQKEAALSFEGPDLLGDPSKLAVARHACAATGPCSDNGDGCSCTDSELSGAADRASNAGGYVPAQTDSGAIDVAIRVERAAIEAEARRYAGFYTPHSDGFNTFVIFADWVAGRFKQEPPGGLQG